MKSKNKRAWIYIVPAVLVTCLLLFVIGILFYGTGKEKPETPASQVSPPEAQTEAAPEMPEESIFKAKITEMPAIEYKNLQKDEALNNFMEKRKEDFNITESLDMIVQSNEEFKIDGIKISMAEILKKARIAKGEVYEESIKSSGEVVPVTNRKYGIYVVQPGDNIWDIHFNIIKEYYNAKGISVEPLADEPDKKGFSSGIGKILKFSEKMVIIYNLKKEKIDTDIDLIQPLSKIVVYNMTEILSLLNEINYDNVDKIQFDGKNIWIATNTSENN